MVMSHQKDAFISKIRRTSNDSDNESISSVPKSDPESSHSTKDETIFIRQQDPNAYNGIPSDFKVKLYNN